MSIANLRAEYPLRPLDWRFQLAKISISENRDLSNTINDPHVKRLCRFLRHHQLCVTDDDSAGLAHRFPHLNNAMRIHDHPRPRCRVELEARVLAGVDDGAIAQRCAATPETVAWYTAVFFDVRDRLAQTSWISSTARVPF